jgi:tetratricopeptide (TPR) repeat protein
MLPSFFHVRPALVVLVSGLILLALAACVSSTRTGLSSDFDYSGRTVDPESAAMQAFARANLMSIDGDFVGSLVALDQAIEIDPDSAFLHLSKADVLLHMGKVIPAKKALEDTLLRAPDQVDAYLTLSEVQTVLGEHPAAVESLVAAQRLQPDDQKILLHLALAHARNQETDTAILLLEDLIKKSPDNRNAYLALARVYMVVNSVQLSVDAYHALIALDPQNEQATLELGALFTQMAQPEQASALYFKFLEAGSNGNRIRYQLVRTALDRDDFDQALQQLSLIVEHDPDDLDALHKIGLIHLQQNNPGLAEQQFKDLLTRRDEATTYYALGIALEEGEKWDEAISTFAQITDDSQHFPDAVIHRAYLLPKLDRRQEAIILLETELAGLEPLPELYEFLASLYSKEKAWSKAVNTLATGLTHFPEDTILLLRQAFILDLSGDMDAALLAAQKVLELDANNAEAFNFIAYAYAVQNIRLEEAEVLVLKAIELADAPHIRDTYGWILFRMNRFADALVELEKAADGIPEDSTILGHLADVYLALGRDQDAILLYQRALAGKNVVDPTAIQKKIDALQAGTNK